MKKRWPMIKHLTTQLILLMPRRATKKLLLTLVMRTRLTGKKTTGVIETDQEIARTGEGAQEADQGTAAAAGKAKSEKRFIMFLGNLPFDASREDVLAHFRFLREQLVELRSREVRR